MNSQKDRTKEKKKSKLHNTDRLKRRRMSFNYRITLDSWDHSSRCVAAPPCASMLNYPYKCCNSRIVIVRRKKRHVSATPRCQSCQSSKSASGGRAGDPEHDVTNAEAHALASPQPHLERQPLSLRQLRPTSPHLTIPSRTHYCALIKHDAAYDPLPRWPQRRNRLSEARRIMARRRPSHNQRGVQGARRQPAILLRRPSGRHCEDREG